MKIRIISPAGKIDKEVVCKGCETLKAWGAEVEIAPHALGSFDRYSGTAQERLQDLLEALTDSSVDVIYCSRGGYGCMHILDQIPMKLIQDNPKWLVGYSDITALHALWQQAGVPSLHAPMLKHLGEVPEHEASAMIREIIMNTRPMDYVGKHPVITAELDLSSILPKTDKEAESHPKDTKQTTTLDVLHFPSSGITGRVIGGNLTVLSALHGTPYDFDYSGKILFIEDIGEYPYRIDRMLQTLRIGHQLRNLKGIIIGQFTNCGEAEDADLIYQNIVDMTTPYSIPIIGHYPVGHTTDNYPFIEGAKYTIL